MKATLYSIDGKKKSEVNMPKIFDTEVREDIIKKCFETMKFWQPYSPELYAGRKHSASGTISHKRHDWKGHYGKGISRVPRKTMWRRGTQFFWIGAEISSARGGRRAHGPKGIGQEKKINKKELEFAMNSALAATGKEKFVTKRYERIDKLEVKVPVIIESNLEKAKTKDMLNMFKAIFGNNLELVLKKKQVRAGKGKLRGRKYKSNAGLLFVKGNNENINMKGIEIKNSSEVQISDLYPLGRLTVYTEKALEEIGGKK